MANSTLSAAQLGGNDAAIIAGLHQWADAVRAYEAHPGAPEEGNDAQIEAAEAEYSALVAAAYAAVAATAAIPATTVEGLAIKSYLSAWHQMGGAHGDALIIDLTGGIMSDNAPTVQLLADLLRLSPALSALLADRRQWLKLDATQIGGLLPSGTVAVEAVLSTAPAGRLAIVERFAADGAHIGRALAQIDERGEIVARPDWQDGERALPLWSVTGRYEAEAA